MAGGQVGDLLALVLAIYFAWSYSRGRSGRVPLYALPWVVTLALLAGAVAQVVGAKGAAEVLNVTGIAFSIAALAGSPGLWCSQVNADLQRTVPDERFARADLLSWAAWLKLARRLGPRRAALWYLGLISFAVLVALLATLLVAEIDRPFAIAAVLLPLPFAGISAYWLYGAARHLLPTSRG